MGFHDIDDPDFFEALTPSELRWTMEIPRQNGMEMATIPIDGAGDAAVAILRFPPGGALPRHAHGCKRIEIVISGSIDVGDGKIAGPGTVMVSEPGEFYGPHRAGPDGAVSVEVFSSLTANTEFDDQGDPEMAGIIAMAARELERLLATHADR